MTDQKTPTHLHQEGVRKQVDVKQSSGGRVTVLKRGENVHGERS